MIVGRALLRHAGFTGKLKRQVLFVDPDLAAVFGFYIVALVEVKARVAPVALGRENGVQRLSADSTSYGFGLINRH